MRTPRRGHTKNIMINGPAADPRNFPIGRLNNYDKEMKKHKGPLSMVSELESIEDAGEKEDITVSSCFEIAKLDNLDNLPNDSQLASGSMSSQVHR